MQKTLKFEIDKINLIELSDYQNALAEVRVCHTGMNAHKMPISLDTLKQASETLVNKWLVAGWSGADFKGHEKEQRIIGFFPKENEFKYIEEDGKTYFVANAIVSKLYAPWAFEIFEEENFRECSMEITLVDTEFKDGFEWIKSYVYNAVTVLGREYTAACAGSSVVIAKFSEEELVDIRDTVTEKFNIKEDKTSLDTKVKKEVEQVNFNKEEFAEKFSTSAIELWDVLVNSEKIEPDQLIAFSKEVMSEQFSTLESQINTLTEKVTTVEGEKTELSDKFSALETSKEELATKFSEAELELKSLKEENALLLEFKANVEETEKQNKIEFAISAVSEDLTPEQVDEWRTKSAEFESIEEFTNAVKAFAYENSKGKPKDGGVVKMSIPTPASSQDNKEKSLWERI